MPTVYPFAARQAQSQQAKAYNQARFLAAAQARKALAQPIPVPTSGWEKWSCRAVACIALLMIPTILLGLWGFANAQ